MSVEESIFDQTDHPNEATRALAKKNKATVDAVNELTHTFHNNHTDKEGWKGNEPDWEYLMRNAATQRQKFEVMATRDAWRDNQKVKVWGEEQKAFNNKVDEVLSTGQSSRNKEFYDNLRKTNPSMFWDVRIQRQMHQDRAVLGLAYHLKGK